MIEVETFEVSAWMHEEEATVKELKWKVFVHVRFRSEDPANWGELRAFGGAWGRTIDRSKSPPAKREISVQLLEKPTFSTFPFELKRLVPNWEKLPEWGHGSGPLPGINSRSLRLANDQHMEIFYKNPVPGVRRSDLKAEVPEEHDYMGYEVLTDAIEPDDINKAERPEEIDLEKWHIVGRDEPGWGTVLKTEFCEYWHQAEFQIREPNSHNVIATKRLFLRVHGLPPRTYVKPLIE